MSHLRTITSFAGKKVDGSRKTDHTEPVVLTADNGSTYIVLVFGAVVAHGELLPSTIRFWFADKATLETVVVGNCMTVEPIEQD